MLVSQQPCSQRTPAGAVRGVSISVRRRDGIRLAGETFDAARSPNGRTLAVYDRSRVRLVRIA